LHISIDRLKGEGKNLNPIRYGPFTILENIGTNAFHLDLSPYMHMYSIVNVKNLKLYDPPMIMDQRETVLVPLVDEFSPNYLDDLKEYTILYRSIRNSCRGDVEHLQVGLKGTHPSKELWIKKGKMRENCPQLFVER